MSESETQGLYDKALPCGKPTERTEAHCNAVCPGIYKAWEDHPNKKFTRLKQTENLKSAQGICQAGISKINEMKRACATDKESRSCKWGCWDAQAEPSCKRFFDGPNKFKPKYKL